MNAWAAAILWGMLQVTVLTAFGLALYVAARRRGPAAGALVSVGTLVAVLTLTILAIAPLPPAWNAAQAWNAITEWSAVNATVAEPAANTEITASADTPPARTVAANPTLPLGMTEFWSAFVDEMRLAPVEQSGAPRRWPMVVLAVFGVGAALGLFRLLAGATAVRSYRRQSRPIADANLFRLVESLRNDTNCRAEVEIRESARLATPATVGCFAPLVLLPSGWRDWSRDELRAVLAHEIAHVARGDFLAGLLAQVTLALHFYHPLVHWLVGRMRLEQELAADATGMQASGGRDSYLVTLAGMALRQDDLAVSWAARPFLPARGTFMRRIEMLRDSRKQVSASLPRGGKALLIVALAAAGLLVAGLRPGQQPAAFAQATDAAKFNFVALPPALSLDYLPVETKVVAAACPPKIFGRPEMAPLTKMINDQFQEQLGMPVEQLELVRVALVQTVGEPEPAPQIMLRSSAPHDWKQTLAKISRTGQTEEINLGSQKYFRPIDATDELCGFLPDDRTLILLPEKMMKPYLANFGRPQAAQPWAPLWERVSKSHAAVAVDPEVLRAQFERTPPGSPAWSFAPLWKESQSAALGLGVGDSFSLQGFAQAASDDGAQRIARTLEAAKTLFSNYEPQLRREIAGEPAEQANFALQALDAGAKVIDSAKLSTEGNLAKLDAQGPGDVAATMAILLPAIAQAREAARRAESMNNLKQIALAMHNYAATYNSFPPAVVIGPDGKTPHSWRVAILPFVEQDALYRQYKLNEPWDSQNNQKVLAQMPRVYRSHQDGRAEPYSSYYVLTGETTVFHGNKGASFTEIQDGSSYTMLAVEAKRDIPWTKPEDIPFDPSQPLPQLGGFAPNGFGGALCDGSVRFFSNATDVGLLSALITKSGQEVIDPNLSGPPRPVQQ